jgi:hypothetical protein
MESAIQRVAERCAVAHRKIDKREEMLDKAKRRKMIRAPEYENEKGVEFCAANPQIIPFRLRPFHWG